MADLHRSMDDSLPYLKRTVHYPMQDKFTMAAGLQDRKGAEQDRRLLEDNVKRHQ